MKKLIILFLILIIPILCINDVYAFSGKEKSVYNDYGDNTLEIPNSTELPATCNTGQIYMHTDATTGQRCYLCESENVWKLQGDGGGGGGGSGSVTTVKENNVQVGDADIIILDFLGTDFVIEELPDTEINIAIDYINGQAATGSAKGFLTSADWTTFNSKTLLTNEASLYSTLSDVTQFYEAGDAIASGVNDTIAGDIILYGDNDVTGPTMKFYNAANKDTTEEYFQFYLNENYFWLGPVANTDAFIFSNAGNFAAVGNSSAATYGSDTSISDAEFLYINTLSSNAQTQINGKQASNTHLDDLADGTLTGSKVQSNSSTSAGVVASGSGQNAQVWKTDASGIPAWRADATGAGGSAIVFDIGDDGGNDSIDVNEIATSGDTNSVFTMPLADKIYIDLAQNWPISDLSALTTNFTCNDNENEALGCNVVFVDGATGSQGAETDGDLTYNPSTGTLAATVFSGDGASLTGIPWDSDFGSNGLMERTGAGTYGLATVDTDYIAPGSNVTLLDGANWQFIYTNGVGDVTEMALGTSGQYLKSIGTAAIPTWDIPDWDMLMANGEAIQLASTTDGHSFAVNVYDVDDSQYRPVFTLTAGNIPTVSLGVGCKLDGLGLLDMNDSGIPAANGEFGYDSDYFLFYAPPAGGMDLQQGGTYKTAGQNVLAVNTIGSFSTPTTTNPYTFTAANSYNSKLYYNATGIVNLAPGVDGMSTIIYNAGAGVITIDPDGTETIVREGTMQNAGVSMTLSGGAGNFVCLVYEGGTWVTLGFNGTLAAGS